MSLQSDRPWYDDPTDHTERLPAEFRAALRRHVEAEPTPDSVMLHRTAPMLLETLGLLSGLRQPQAWRQS
jgi:hypothetical protein